MDDIIGAMGMENKMIEGTIDKGAELTVVIVLCNIFTMCVIGHNIGGINFPDKMARLAKCKSLN